MQLFLHIGTGRTGTQSLQDFLKHNSKALVRHGILYPLLEGRNHHNPIALPVCGDRPPRYLNARFGSDPAANLEAFESYFDTLEAMVRDASPNAVILSSEFLGRAFSPELGEPLFRRLRGLFDEITIIVYLRSPGSYYLSAALQTLKASGILKRPAKQVARRILQSYDPLGARLVVRQYDRKTLLRGDVCQDFISALAPELVGKLPAASRQKNETLSAEVMSIIQDYRNIVWPDAHNVFNDETDGLLETLLEVAAEHGLYRAPRLKPELAETLNALDHDMLWLRETHGFEYSDIDYSAEPVPVKKIPGKFVSVADVCVMDETVKEEIMLRGLGRYSAESVAARSSARARNPITAAAELVRQKITGIKPQPVFAGELQRIKALEENLRLPEREVYDTPRNNRLFRETGQVVIRNNFPPFDLDDLTDWTVNPTGNVVWRIYFNSLAWTSVFSDEDVRGNPQEPDWDRAQAVLEAFVSHVEAHGDDPRNDIWDDHATGYRASYIAYLYTRGLAERLTPQFNARLRKVMIRHREKLMSYLSSDRWAFSNHTLFQAEGLADLAMIFLTDETRRHETLEFARQRVDAFIARAISHAEGTVKEHSLFYHVFLMGRLQETCAFFERIGYPLKNASDDLFTRMNQFLHDIMPVPGRLPGIGDSKHFQRFDRKYVAPFEEPRFETPRIRYLRSGGETGEAPPFLSRYPEDGYFIFRSHDPLERQLHSVYLHRAFRGPHGHWDGMSFVCHWQGKPVFIDSGGPYKYGTAMRYKYFQTQLAHNAPIFDEDPVALETRLLDDVEAADFGAVAVGARMGKGRSWVRIFGQIGNRAVLLVDLPVSTSPDARPTIRLHVDPAFEVAADGGMLSAEFGQVSIARQTLALPRNAARRLGASLPDSESDAVISHRVPPEERQKAGLEADFDRRSYITYKDNEMTEGKLLVHDLAVNRASLTVLGFGAPAPDVAMELNGNRIRIDLAEAGGAVPLIEFDLATARFAR